MHEQEKLSVVIPVYNGEQHIVRCVESVLSQSMKDIHIYLVDDGSNDGTAEIATSYAKHYNNISLISHPENKGTGAARNSGLSTANSKFVSFLDADDWVDTNSYMKMYKSIEETGADIAVCGIRTEYYNSCLSKVRYDYPYENHISSRFALRLLSRLETQDSYVSPMAGNKIYRMDLLKKNNLFFPNRSINEDDEFTFLSLCHADSVVLVPNVYHHYFQRESSAMHTFSKQHIDCLVQVFENIKSRLAEEGLFERYSDEYYSFLDRCLSSTLNVLFSCEQSITKQRQYITYLLECLLKSFTIQELTLHIDPRRLQRLWI